MIRDYRLFPDMVLPQLQVQSLKSIDTAMPLRTSCEVQYNIEVVIFDGTFQRVSVFTD